MKSDSGPNKRLYISDIRIWGGLHEETRKDSKGESCFESISRLIYLCVHTYVSCVCMLKRYMYMILCMCCLRFMICMYNNTCREQTAGQWWTRYMTLTATRRERSETSLQRTFSGWSAECLCERDFHDCQRLSLPGVDDVGCKDQSEQSTRQMQHMATRGTESLRVPLL